ncbi:MAG: glycosyltransferase family 4 protein [Planctomycetota bacterium]
MKILYDHQIFGVQRYGGISRYFLELMNQFKQMGEPEFELSLVYSKNHYLNEAGRNDNRFFFKNPKFRPRLRSTSAVNMAKSKRAASKQHFDVFHPTYYDPYFLNHLKEKPFVLTVYDMIHEILRSQYSERDRTAENKRLLIARASKIIAISQNTKRDILRLVPEISEDKIAVIYLASSVEKRDGPPPHIEAPEKYILFVGGRGVHKNFPLFIKAVEPLIAQDNDLKLVCAGGGRFKPREEQFLSGSQLEDQIYQYDVDDRSLALLYEKALVLVFPTLYEGFGNQVLEGFACHCPVVCSNTSSLPEVGGDAAVYFDPTNETSIRQAIVKVIYDEELRSLFIAKGLKQLEKFSWREIAQQTMNLYRSVL